MTGLLVDPDPPAAFVPATLKLLADPATTARMTDRARENLGALAPEAHLGAIEALYAELLRTPRP